MARLTRTGSRRLEGVHRLSEVSTALRHAEGPPASFLASGIGRARSSQAGSAGGSNPGMPGKASLGKEREMDSRRELTRAILTFTFMVIVIETGCLSGDLIGQMRITPGFNWQARFGCGSKRGVGETER